MIPDKKTLEDVFYANRSPASGDGLESAEWDAVDPVKSGPAAAPRKPMTGIEALQIASRTFNALPSTVWWGAGQGLDALREAESGIRDFIGHPGSKERQDLLKSDTATLEDLDKIWDLTNVNQKQPDAGTFLRKSGIAPNLPYDTKFYGGLAGDLTLEELIGALGSMAGSKIVGDLSKAGASKLFNKPYTGSTRAVIAKGLPERTSIGNQVLEGINPIDRVPVVGSVKRTFLDTPVTEKQVFNSGMGIGKTLRDRLSSIYNKMSPNSGSGLSFDSVLTDAKNTLSELRKIDNPVAQQHADDLAQWITQFESNLSGKSVTPLKAIAEKRFAERGLPAWAQNMAGKVKNTQAVQAVQKTAKNIGGLIEQMAEKSGVGNQLKTTNARLSGQITGIPKTMSRFLNETTNQGIFDSLKRTGATIGGRGLYELTLPYHAYGGVPGAAAAGAGKVWEGLRLDDIKPAPKQKLLKQGDGLEPAEW